MEQDNKDLQHELAKLRQHAVAHTNKVEDILDREAKRNDKLERDMHHLTIEHKIEKEQLVRELLTLRFVYYTV